MSSTQKSIYDMFTESQYWPPERMLDFQRNQLAQLLRHARATVPFYETRLDVVFKTDGKIDWARWHEIPIVKRQDLATRRESMLARKLPPGHGQASTIFSSGSTAEPVSITHNSLARWVSEIAVYRAHRWYGLDWSKTWARWLVTDKPAAIAPDGEEDESWSPNWLDPGARGKRFSIWRSASAEQVLDFVLRKKASYLSGRPRNLQTLAHHAEQLNIPLKLAAVSTFATSVTDDEHEDFGRVFGAQVISYYSSGEGYKMAISCETGHHYHVNSEFVYLEILDDDGNPCAIGQPGRVIITPMFNSAQPLIRYDQGDIAIRGRTCSCGKTLPVLQEISGRVSHLFRFPDGQKIAPSLPNREFNAGFGASIWQLVQTKPLTVELRYVAAEPNATVDKVFATDLIRRKLNPELLVKFVELPDTPLTAAGKFIQYKSELAEPV